MTTQLTQSNVLIEKKSDVTFYKSGWWYHNLILYIDTCHIRLQSKVLSWQLKHWVTIIQEQISSCNSPCLKPNSIRYHMQHTTWKYFSKYSGGQILIMWWFLMAALTIMKYLWLLVDLILDLWSAKYLGYKQAAPDVVSTWL